MKQNFDADRLLKLLFLLIIAIAALLRFPNIFSALEYDEIWTLENFSRLGIYKLLTELALPNNQPLNSLFVKLIVSLGGPVWAIRLHSFIAGVLLLPLAGFIAYVLSGKNKFAALAAMFFIAFSAPDMVYSSLARGYALQVFFLALYAAGLAATGTFRPQGKYRFLPECAMALGGICAILTLPTSVVYLGAITLAAWLVHPVKPPRSLLVVLGGGVVFTLFWCLFNYQQLNAARVWGSKIRSFADFYGFLAVTTAHHLKIIPLILSLFFFKNKKYRPLLLFILLPLLSAVVTNAGPPRTYIPFGCFFAVCAGCGAAELINGRKKNLQIIIIALTALLGVAEFRNGLKAWSFPDSCEIFRQASKIPADTLVIHRATSGYPLAWNNQPKIYDDFVKRILEHSKYLVMFDAPGRINGNDPQNNEAVISTDIRGEEINDGVLHYRKYRLEELSTPPAPGDTIIIVLRPMAGEMMQFYLNQLAVSGFYYLKLNPWLTRYITRPETTYRYALLAGTVTDKTSLNWKMFLDSNGSISIYRIR